MIDLHYAMTIRAAWAALAGDLPAWREMLPPDSRISQEVKDQWHDLLFPGGRSIVEFGQSYDGKKPKVLQVTVGVMDNASEHQPLGYAVGRDDDGTPLVGLLADEHLLVNCYGPNKELVRAIWWVVRSITIQYGAFMLRAGYENFSYVGGGDLMGEQGMAFEANGVFVRTTRWTYTETVTVRVPSEDIPSITSVIVAHVDATVDGDSGGATPL